jgi:hypothetical protein
MPPTIINQCQYCIPVLTVSLQPLIDTTYLIAEGYCARVGETLSIKSEIHRIAVC